MEKTILAELKKALEDEHDVLVEELKSIAKRDPKLPDNWDARFPQFEDPETGEHGASGKLEQEQDEVEEYEVRLAAEHSLESRLLEVNKALDRMKRGTFGVCTQCGKEISMERLGANPAAETHLEHV
jgi:RNA polymerase-binding transcription factor DksA